MIATFDATPEPRSANMSAIRSGRRAAQSAPLGSQRSAGVTIPIETIMRAARALGLLITRRRRAKHQEELPVSGLRHQQSEFAIHAARLIQQAYLLGYEVPLGEAYRPPETAALYERHGRGVAKSYHCLKLAIDLALFKDGVYLTTTEDYRELGEWWESIGGTWGGLWQDGNHFSWGESR